MLLTKTIFCWGIFRFSWCLKKSPLQLFLSETRILSHSYERKVILQEKHLTGTMAAAQEEDFVDYEEEEEQVAVQTGKDTKKYETLSFIPNCFFHFCWFVQQFPEDENNFQLAVNQRSKLFYSMEHFFLPKNIAILLPQTFVENKNSNQASSNTIHITNYFLWIAFFQFCDAACNNTFHQSCQFCHLRHLTIIQGTLCRYSHFEFS